MNMTTNHQLNPYAVQLCTLGRWISAKQWVPAGSGDFSIRSDQHSCLITRQHKDKGELSPHDLQHLSWADGEARLPAHSSATSLLHVALYQASIQTKVVLHTQSVAANVLSQHFAGDHHQISGYAIQSVITGQQPSQQGCYLAIFDPQQPLPLLAASIRHRYPQLQQGFLLRGHGLFVWGDTLDQAKRHLEAWEFLLCCELERLKSSGPG